MRHSFKEKKKTLFCVNNYSCNGKSKVLCIPKWLPHTILQVPEVAAGSQSQAGTTQLVPQVTAVGHEGQKSPRQGATWWVRDLDEAASPTRRDTAIWARHRSPKVASPGHGATPG